MSGFQSLSETVAREIATGRIGRPVSVRAFLEVTADHGRLLAVLADAAREACGWLADRPDRLHAAGSLASGHVTLFLRGAWGSTALLSAALLRSAPARADLLVIGNRGTLRFDGMAAAGGVGLTGATPGLEEPSPEAAGFLRAVQQALKTGKPVRVELTARPAGRGQPAAEAPGARESPGAAEGGPLGVLLVSGGRTHQENYARLFQADPRCRLMGLTDERDLPAPRERWNRELARELGVPYLESLEEALARADVHVASVCAEPERRGRLGALCAGAGKHLYMDKPLAGSLEGGRALVEAVRQAGVRSQMFSMVRQPWARRAREIVRSGAIGELLGLHCDLLFAKGPSGTAPLRPRKEHYPPRRFTFTGSKRELFTTGVYSIGLMRWLSGREVERVRAATENYFFAEHVENDVEDFGAAVLHFTGGLVGTLTAGRIGWASHPADGPMRLCLVGTGGSVLVDAHRPRLEVSCDTAPWVPPPRHPEDPMGFWSSTRRASGEREKQAWRPVETAPAANDASHLIDCILAGRESDMSAADGRAILEALFACYRSAATGEVVELS